MIGSYQAFPILSDTFIGAPTNQARGSQSLVRIEGDGVATFTFHFPSGDKIITPPSGTSDHIYAGDCTGVTSTLACIIS